MERHGGPAAGRLHPYRRTADLTYSPQSTQAAGDRFFANLTLDTLALLAKAHGALTGARAYLGQALTGAGALGDQYGLTIVLCTLGDVARMAGQLRDAQSYYAEALRGVVHMGHVRVCEAVLCGLAELAMTRG